jgi:hypothetical protein
MHPFRQDANLEPAEGLRSNPRDESRTVMGFMLLFGVFYFGIQL